MAKSIKTEKANKQKKAVKVNSAKAKPKKSVKASQVSKNSKSNNRIATKAKKTSKSVAKKVDLKLKKTSIVSKSNGAAQRKSAPTKKAPIISKISKADKEAAKTGNRSFLSPPVKSASEARLNPFLKKQKERLLQLRDGMLDSMLGVAKDNLRARAEGNEASAFGMHQADAGSDAYDRDFALSLLSQEQDALYEIDEALKRIENGAYGVCEISAKPIPHARLEAIPFARLTVECQSQLERQHKVSRIRVPVTSLFGLTDEEGTDSEEEESSPDTKDKE